MPDHHMPQGIPTDMKDLYHKEVSALLQDLSIFAHASEGNGILRGEAILQATFSAHHNGQASEILEWMMDELQALLTLHASAIEGNPEYIAQSIRELLDNCRDKIAAKPSTSTEKIALEVQRRREAGIYQAEAELLILSQCISIMNGNNPEEDEDITLMALQLERADHARLLAHLAPEVQLERERLGKVEYIASPKDVSQLFSSLLSEAVH